MTYTPSFDTCSIKELPPAAFSDRELFRKEMETFFQTAWISIGIGAQVPNQGDVNPIGIAGQPLLIVRGAKDDIQVFHNVCRHRGLQAPLAP